MSEAPFFWPEDARSLQGGWAFSTAHSASSYGIPVLVSPKGDPFKPGDLLNAADVAQMRGVRYQSLHQSLRRGATEGWMRVGTNGGWAIFAADAVRP